MFGELSTDLYCLFFEVFYTHVDSLQNPDLLISESRKPDVSSRVQKLFRQIQRQIHAAEIHDLRRTALSPTADYSGFRNTILPGPPGEHSGLRNTGLPLLKADRSGFQRTVLPLDSSVSPAKHVSQVQVKHSVCFSFLLFLNDRRIARMTGQLEGPESQKYKKSPNDLIDPCAHILTERLTLHH
jgi:hypothetical protein